jgi:hypothetical protein
VWVNYDAYRSAYCAAQSCWFPTRSKCELFSESCSFLGHQLKQLWASAREPTCQRRGKNSSGIWQPQFLFSQRETQNKNREGILRGRRERAKGDKWTREEKSLEQIQTNQSQYPQATRLHWTTPLSPPSKNARLHRFPRREKKSVLILYRFPSFTARAVALKRPVQSNQARSTVSGNLQSVQEGSFCCSFFVDSPEQLSS